MAHSYLVYIGEAESEAGQTGRDFLYHRVDLAAGVAAGLFNA
jgi:hypothetical protein